MDKQIKFLRALADLMDECDVFDFELGGYEDICLDIDFKDKDGGISDYVSFDSRIIEPADLRQKAEELGKV